MLLKKRLEKVCCFFLQCNSHIDALLCIYQADEDGYEKDCFHFFFLFFIIFYFYFLLFLKDQNCEIKNFRKRDLFGLLKKKIFSFFEGFFQNICNFH